MRTSYDYSASSERDQKKKVMKNDCELLPEALWLAEELKDAAGDYTAWNKTLGYKSVKELHRQHAEIERLTAEVEVLRVDAKKQHDPDKHTDKIDE